MRFPEDVEPLLDDLYDRYSLGNSPRILELKNKICDCRRQQCRSVAAVFW